MHLHSMDSIQNAKSLCFMRTTPFIGWSCNVSFILSTSGTSTVLNMCNILLEVKYTFFTSIYE